MFEISFFQNVKSQALGDLEAISTELHKQNYTFEDKAQTIEVASKYFQDSEARDNFISFFSANHKKTLVEDETVSLKGEAAMLFLEIQGYANSETTIAMTKEFLRNSFIQIYSSDSDLTNREKNILLSYITVYETALDFIIINNLIDNPAKAVNWSCAAAVAAGAIAGAGSGGVAGVEIGGAIGRRFGKRGQITGSAIGAISGLIGGAIGGGLGGYVYKC